MKFMKIMNVINVTSVKIFDRSNPFFQEATFDGRLFINHVSNMTKPNFCGYQTVCPPRK